MDQSNTVDVSGTLRVAVVRTKAAGPGNALVEGLPNTHTLVNNEAVVAAANDGANRHRIPLWDQRWRTKRDGRPKHAAKQIVPVNVRDRPSFHVDAHSPVAVEAGCCPSSRIAHGPRIDIVVHPCWQWESKSHYLVAAFLRDCHSDNAGEVAAAAAVHRPNSFLPGCRVDIAVVAAVV